MELTALAPSPSPPHQIDWPARAFFVNPMFFIKMLAAASQRV